MKFKLSKETIRQLTDEELSQVGGADGATNGQCTGGRPLAR